jgi:tetratricopeptide (TPR) repeat protein/tRNA A-37 threonylcarbamoyl transferase component Bud32
MSIHTVSTGDDDQLDQILLDYLRAQDAGTGTSREALLARYPAQRQNLAAFFAAEDCINRVTEPLQEVVHAAQDATISSAGENGNESLLEGAAGSFGDYELLGQLAEGGMGIVYKARHRKLNRIVALKLLRTGQGAPLEERQRFRNEAEAAAHLDHPHISPVFDVGEYQGVPFLSMKLMEGGSLAGRLSKYRDDPKAAARLVAVVARAVHYGHQRGILHRDIKPSNVLLDAESRPYVADFGLAKRLGSANDLELTRSGAIVGTPAYMAPEQASGRRGAVTTATDVYGLGALLYALLTGKPPFQEEDVLEALQRLQSEEPVPPSRLNSAVGRDLELICLKCLSKDPQHRYTGANIVADELERYADGRSLVHTRAVSASERLIRWCRRNPAWAALSAVASFSLVAVIAMAVAYVMSLRAASERERQLRQRAESSRDLALDSVDRFFTKVSDSRQLQVRGLERYRQDLLRQAAGFYEQLLTTETEDPSVQAEGGRAHFRLGRIAEALGNRAEAGRRYEEARVVFEGLAAQHPDEVAHREDLARVLHTQGSLHQVTGRNVEAVALLEHAFSLRQELARQHPENLLHDRELAETAFQIARQYQVTGQPVRAEAKYAEILPFFEQRLRERPDDPESCDLLAKVLHNLGDLKMNRNRNQAPEYFQRAIALEEKALLAQPDNPALQDTLAQSLDHLGLVDHKMRKESRDAYQRAVTLKEKALLAQPDDPALPESLAKSVLYLGLVDRKMLGRAAYERAVGLRERLANDHPDVPDYRMKLLTSLHGQGDLMKYEARLAEARTVFERALTLAAPIAELYRDDRLAERELAALTYDAACCYALSSAALGKDPTLSRAARLAQSEHDAVRAMELLRETRRIGFAKIPLSPALLKGDADLQPLHSRADFQAFVGEFEKSTAKAR